jgi:hypothetical protein
MFWFEANKNTTYDKDFYAVLASVFFAYQR